MTLEYLDKKTKDALERVGVVQSSQLQNLNPYELYRQKGIGRRRVWLVLEAKTHAVYRQESESTEALCRRLFDLISDLLRRSQLSSNDMSLEQLLVDESSELPKDFIETASDVFVTRKHFDLQRAILGLFFSITINEGFKGPKRFSQGYDCLVNFYPNPKKRRALRKLIAGMLRF